MGLGQEQDAQQLEPPPTRIFLISPNLRPLSVCLHLLSLPTEEEGESSTEGCGSRAAMFGPAGPGTCSSTWSGLGQVRVTWTQRSQIRFGVPFKRHKHQKSGGKTHIYIAASD